MFWGKMTVSLSFKNFPLFYGTGVSLPYSKVLRTDPILKHLNNFTSSQPVSLRSILMLFCFLHFGLLDCPFRPSAGVFENLRFKIWNTPGEKYQFINGKQYPLLPVVSHHFWNSLCHDFCTYFCMKPVLTLP